MTKRTYKLNLVYKILLKKNDRNIEYKNEQELIDIYFYEINYEEYRSIINNFLKKSRSENTYNHNKQPYCENNYIIKNGILTIIYPYGIVKYIRKNDILTIMLIFNNKRNLEEFVTITNQIYEDLINNGDKVKNLINRIENTQLQDKDKKIIKHFPFSKYCNIERKKNELLYKNNKESFKIFHDGEHSFLFDLLTINDTYNLILNWLIFLKEYFEYFSYDEKGYYEKLVPKYIINNNFNYNNYINDLGNTIYINLFMSSLKKKDNYYIFCNCIVLSFNDNKLNIYFDNRNFNNPHINITLFNLYGYKYDEEKTFLKKDEKIK